MGSLKKYRSWLLLAALALSLSACGGENNPTRIDTGYTPPFFNGLWDAITMPWVFVVDDIIRRNGNVLYVHGAGDGYILGYIVGLIVLVAMLPTSVSFTRSTYRRTIRRF